ncbi:MAG: hypothetical protein HN768_07510 [Rhodospirillaceae bacterium]|nr:hypothetical protein [Rhodospirillaceae bacterium]
MTAVTAGQVGTAGSETLNGTGSDDVIAGLNGADTLVGNGGEDQLFGGGGDDVLYGDTLHDFAPMPHAISNVVLYLQDDAGEVLKVKVDSFSDSETDVFDANDLDLQSFIDDNYDEMEMVAITIKAGNNKSGMGTGEGELFVIDDSVAIEDLQAAGGKKGQADASFDYVTDLEPLGTPDEGDLLIGGTDDDELYGGVGADTFVFADGDGHDTIGDFQVGEDMIDLGGVSGISDFSGVLAAASNDGDDAVIALDDGSITLAGVQIEGLSVSDFLFA